MGATLGKIISLHPRLRFAVLDFSLNPLPSPGEKFDVLRNSQTVGHLKISGPARGTSIAADWIDGDLVIGDTVQLSSGSR
jgi:hypothetical protein